MVENLVLIDTSAWIAIDRPKQNPQIESKVSKVLDEDKAAICGIIRLELLSGAKTEKEYEELTTDLASLHYLSTPEEIWLKANRMAFSLRRIGLTIPSTDIMIACIAIENGCSLIHLDNHFNLIASKTRLKIE